MGFGWYTSDPPNFFYAGVIEHSPSFTKAEIMVILAALIVFPSNSYITIYTDLQLAIDSFYKSKKLSITSTHHCKK